MESAVEQITEVFRKELRISDVKPDDDFFDLGGDSLNAETIMTSLQRLFDIDLEISTLLVAPSPEELAREVKATQLNGKWNKLVTKIPNCTGSNAAVMIHGMSGSPLFVSRLKEKFKAHCQIYAIRGMGLGEGEDTLDTLDDISEAYTSGVQSHAGNDVRIYGGICLGGLIAVNLALDYYNRTGQRPILILIDPPPLGSAWLKPMKNNHLTIKRQKQLKGQAERWKNARDFFVQIGLSGSVLGRKARREAFKKSLTRAIAGYKPEPFPCDILLIASSDWGKTTIEQYQNWVPDQSSIKCIPIEGNHGNFQTANAASIDDAIADFLEEFTN